MGLLFFLNLVVAIFFVVFLTSVSAQSARRNGANGDQLDPVEPGTEEFQERRHEECSDRFRTFDGSCTNSENKLWGSAGTSHFSYVFHHSSKVPTGQDLPSPRLISNIVTSQSENVFNSRGLSEFVVFFGQFLDHTFVATASNVSEQMPIPIPSDDPIFSNFSDGVLSFSRSVRGLVTGENGTERSINSLSSAIDLATVYSSDDDRISALREFSDGLMKTSEGDLLPVNLNGLVNAPTKEASYFLAGDHRANEHPVLTAFHTLFVREHNRLCHELKEAFPLWNDSELFQMARKINGAQFQKIVYEEWLPLVTGRNLQRYKGYNPKVNPTISDIFSTAAFRLGHTLVGNVITKRGPNNVVLPSLTMDQMFFRTLDVMESGIDPFLRGAMGQPAQEVDAMVVPALRNFLFTGIPQEKGFDLIALNLQRSRDHALPSYNEIRKLFGRKPATRFRHITRNLALQNRLQTAYGTPDRVEAWIGLVSEDHLRGSSLGPTLLRIWKAEFTRLRDGDRFFYRRWSLFEMEIWQKVPRLRQMMFEKQTMKQIILRNCDITEAEIGRSVWTV